MPADYDAIRRENIEEYGKGLDRWARRFLDKLYSDETHFVYELLQNAEDAGACRVKFTLYSNCLEFEHDGREFNERDVRGICGLADTEKYEDITQIGRFGLGFKSVHAYTRTPEIHSGMEHFSIDKYVRPHAIESEHSELGTRFRFPFNHEEKTSERSHADIAGRLRDLGIRTLLFLQNIESIDYEVVDDAGGVYLRQLDETLDENFATKVMLLGKREGEEEIEENWLVFNRDVSSLAQADNLSLSAKIAFLLQDTEDEGSLAIQCVRESDLVVSFPTAKETKLDF